MKVSVSQICSYSGGGRGGWRKYFINERVCIMIHIDGAINPIQADLGRLQNDYPDIYNQLGAMKYSRKWSIIIYPKSPAFPYSSVDDLYDCLYNFYVQHQLTGCLSPLHDRDVLLGGFGGAEEEHYHFMAISRSPMSARLIGSLCYFLGGVKNGNLPPVKEVENELGYYRYYTHQDDLDKAAYDSNDIVCINGYTPPCSGNGSTQSATQELLELVDKFQNLSELTAYVIHVRRDLFNVLLRSKNLIATYYDGLDNY